MSDSLWPQGLQHATLPCPSLSPRVCSNLCPLSSVMLPNHLILWHPFSLCLQSFPAPRSLPKELALCIRWPKYWIFTFSISPSNEYSGVISFRIDWFDCRAVQRTLKFFIVQLSHLYLTTGKPRALTIQIFVSKVMSLLFNILPRFVIAFLPNSKRLLISWLQSPSAGILEPKKIKSVTASTFPPSICHEVMGLDAMIFVFWMLSSEPAFSLSSFTLIRKLFSFSPLSAIRVAYATSAYLRLLIFLPAILIPAWDSFSLTSHMMCSACKLDKSGSNTQPCHTPCQTNQSTVPCLLLFLPIAYF